MPHKPGHQPPTSLSKKRKRQRTTTSKKTWKKCRRCRKR